MSIPSFTQQTSTIQTDRGVYSRRLADSSYESSVVNRLENLLAGGFIRAPVLTQLVKRIYFAQPEQPVNQLTTSFIVPIVFPSFQTAQELGTVPLRDRRALAHMPEMFRPAPNPSTPLNPFPVGQATDWNAITFIRDKLKGHDLEIELFLTPQPFSYSAIDLPNPTRRKTWLVPEQVPNERLPAGSLTFAKPFVNSDQPLVAIRRRPARFDDPPNLLSGVYNIPSGPPYYQTDWITPRRSYYKHVGLWECINSQIPDNIPPFVPPPPFPGGGKIFGQWLIEHIFGFFS